MLKMLVDSNNLVEQLNSTNNLVKMQNYCPMLSPGIINEIFEILMQEKMETYDCLMK